MSVQPTRNRWLRTRAPASVLLAMLAGAATANAEDLPSTGSAPPPLDQLVAEAAADYPSIQAEWAEVEAMRQREAQVTQPFDPMVMLGVQNLPARTFSFTEDPMTGVMLGLSQQFYWPGVLNARGAEARAQVRAMQAEVPEMAYMLWSEAVEPYYMVVEADRMANVLSARRAVLQTLGAAAQAAYEARMASLTDAMRVNAQISSLDLELAEVRRDRRTAVAELNGMLNRPASVPLDVDATFEASEDIPSEDAWLELAIANRPAFAALRANQDWIVARRGAAEAMDDPMWSASASWMFRFQEGDAGMDMINLQLGISLPFFSARRVDAELSELSSQSFAIERRRDELLRAVRAEIGRRLAAMASLRDEIATLEGELIPRIEDTYESAAAHYSTRHEGLESLMEIQDQLLMLEMARVRLLSEYDREHASLRALAGDSDAIRQIRWVEQ